MKFYFVQLAKVLSSLKLIPREVREEGRAGGNLMENC